MARFPVNTKSKIGNATNKIVASWLSPDSESPAYYDYKRMFEEDDISALAFKCLGLMTCSGIGEYANGDLQKRDEVRESLALFKGSWQSKLNESCAYMPYGYYVAEIVFKFEDGIRLDQINPFQYDPVPHFYGTTKEIKEIQSSELSQPLPYRPGFVFHLVNEPGLAPGKTHRYGFPMAKRAYKAWLSAKIVSAQYVVASQKQAEKLLVGKTDTNADLDTGLLDLQGNPIYKKAGEDMRDTLEQAQNGSVIVLDLQDELDAIDQTSTGQFYLDSLYYWANVRSRSFYNPQTLFGGNKSGVGDAGLAEAQQRMFLTLASANAAYMATEAVEQIFRPMIEYNHGKQPNYGEFPIQKDNPQALEIAKILIDALQKETLSSSSERAIKRVEEILGVSEN